MKKRVIGLMLVAAMVLLLSASVWAASTPPTPTHSKLDNVVAQLVKKCNVDATAGSTFNIPVQAQIAVASSGLSGYTNSVANKVVFSIEVSDASAFEGNPVLANSEKSVAIEFTDTYPVTTKVSGIVKGDATITVTATAYKDATQIGNSDTATITFTTQAGTDITDASFITDSPYEEVPVAEDPNPLADTPGDPESNNWDGIEPPFAFTTENGNFKDKPTFNTSKLVFNGTGASKDVYTSTSKALVAGASADFTVEIQGDSLDIVDVYIAAADAIKLWPLSCDKKYNKAIEGTKWTEDISLTQANIKKWKIPFRVTSKDTKLSTATTGKTKDKVLTTLTIAYNGAQVAYKGFPLTIAASNQKTRTTNRSGTTNKPVTKKFTIDVNSSRSTPQWVTATGDIGDNMKPKNAQDLSVALADGGTLGGTIYTVSAEAPYYITAKGDKIGISSDIVQPVFNRFGEIATPGYVKVYGTFDKSNKGTKDGTKESKVSFTLDAVGSVKKTTFKPNVIGKVSPYYEAKALVTSKDTTYAGVANTVTDGAGKYDGYLKGVKTAEAGKVPTVKFAPKGSKTITFAIDADELEALNDVGLSFDKKTGAVVQLQETVTDPKTNRPKKVKVPTTPTLNEIGDAYEPIEITATADNGTGHTAELKALVGVTGAKPLLGKVNKGVDYSKITVNRSDLTAGKLIPIRAMIGKYFVTPESGDAGVAIVTYSLQNKKSSKTNTPDTDALEGLGLELYSADKDYSEESYSVDDSEVGQSIGYFVVTSDEIKANNKGAKVNLVLENFGMTNNVSTTIVIRDDSPDITTTSTDTITLTSTAAKQTFVLPLTVDNLTAPDAKITWKLGALSGTKPNTKNLRLAIKAGTGQALTANVTLELLSCDYEGTFDVTATNVDKRSNTKTFTLNVSKQGTVVEEEETQEGTQAHGGAYTAKDTAAAPYDKVKDEAEAEDDSEEAKVVFGAPRTAANLTAGQLSFIQSRGYTVIAVLPEVTADKDGQVEIPVELDEDAPEGAKMVYLPFAKDGGAEDDEIVDFYDAEGAPIEEVPAGKTITAAPWLRAGVTYEPVIAVESK